MTACAGVGEMQEAEELLDAMQRAGIRADIRAYNILLTGYSRHGAPEARNCTACYL